ncbi:MAG: apolipoprotein N-acyltransferase, partial [Terrimicrobiaceae bacterium]
NALGIALNKNIALIQIADITGVGGLSFLIVFANLMAVTTVKRLLVEVGRGARRAHYDFALTVGAIALAWTYGIRQLLDPAPDSTPLTFAAVQANIPQATRNDPDFEFQVLDKYRELTETAIAMRPDLILWPESAPPRPLFNDQNTWETMKSLAEAHDGDILIGTVHFSEQGDYNSVALLTDHAKSAQMYHKMHLVPFGEYVPFRSGFPLFAWVVGDLVPDDFDPGQHPEVLEMAAQPVRIGPLVCFEDTLGNLARQFALRGAQLFAVVTNDGWFLQSAGSRQHLQNAIFRCAENKIPMIRAANTGVTCLVDRFGVVREELRAVDGNTFVEGVLFQRVDVPKNPVPTFYARFGDVFSYACLALSLGGIVLFVVRIRKKKDSACPNPDETKISPQ